MIRIPGWIFGSAFAIVVAACGAGDTAEEQPPAQANPPVRPQPRAAQPPQAVSEPEPERRPEPERPSPAVTGRLYTVQVAAFDTPDEARLWADRLSQRGYPAWTTRAVVNGRTFHRLRIGASPSVSETRGLGERITREFRWPFWIAPVEDAVAVPADAVSRTHSLVSGA